MFMYGHQVVGFAPRLREPPLQEIIEGRQLLEPPVLTRPHLTQITPKLNEASVLFRFLSPLPTEDLVNLRQHEHCTFLVQLRRHRRCPSTQVRQTHQGSELLGGGSGPRGSTAVDSGRVRRMDKCCMGSAGSVCRCEAETGRI